MNPIIAMHIDLETYSACDIGKCGHYRYAEDPSTIILLFGVSIQRQGDSEPGPVHVYDLASGEKLPTEILEALVDDNVLKWAHNASFERVILSLWLQRNYPYLFKGYGSPEDTCGRYLSAKSWRCTMVWSAYLGLPLSLKAVGAALGFDKQKLSEGHDLIRYFCVPNKNGNRNLPADAPADWSQFKKYNKRDVEVELQIYERLSNYPVPDFIWDQYAIDQQINDRGIMIDQKLASNAIRMDSLSHCELESELKDLTGLDNPNSVSQMKDYLQKQGVQIDSLGKKDVEKLLEDPSIPDDIKHILTLRQQLAKSSVKKYEAMMNCVCSDGRAHGLFQFWGANRTGRWAGRLIQLQNLPQNHMPDLDEARDLVKSGDYEMMKRLYENIPATLSELIRTTFIAKPGYKYVVSDYSAIEARVLSYLAGEQWRIDVFANNGDIYCESASQMFHVPVVKNGVNGGLRAKGKIAELALGYGGGVGALRAMQATKYGVKEEELQPLVDSWRSASPHIVSFWWKVDRAAKDAIKKKNPTYVSNGKVTLTFHYEHGMLFIELPSGRHLAYARPEIGTNQYGGESITYMDKNWVRVETYGPKLTENITQAFARDVLAFAMQTLRDRFICAHVHDELIIEVPEDTKKEEIQNLMGITPPWAPGLLLRADGYETKYYLKA